MKNVMLDLNYSRKSILPTLHETYAYRLAFWHTSKSSGSILPKLELMEGMQVIEGSKERPELLLLCTFYPRSSKVGVGGRSNNFLVVCCVHFLHSLLSSRVAKPLSGLPTIVG